MDELLKKLRTSVDYENMNLEEIDANLYEISVATAKYAREINEKARKFYGSDVDILPRNMAVKKLENNTLNIGYPEKEDEEES